MGRVPSVLGHVRVCGLQRYRRNEGEHRMIELHCPHCSHLLRISDQYAGQQGRCRTCKGVVLVPPPLPRPILSEPPPLPARKPVDAGPHLHEESWTTPAAVQEAHRPKRTFPLRVALLSLLAVSGSMVMMMLSPAFPIWWGLNDSSTGPDAVTNGQPPRFDESPRTGVVPQRPYPNAIPGPTLRDGSRPRYPNGPSPQDLVPNPAPTAPNPGANSWPAPYSGPRQGYGPTVPDPRPRIPDPRPQIPNPGANIPGYRPPGGSYGGPYGSR